MKQALINRVIQVVEDNINKYTNQVDWVTVVSTLNKEFGMNKKREYYRSIYRRNANKGAHALNKVGSKSTPFDFENKRISLETLASGEQKSEMLVNIVKHPLKTPNDILELHGYDIFQFKVKKHRLSIWNAQVKDAGVQELHSSQLVVEPIQQAVDKEFIEQVIEEMVDKHFTEPYKTYSPFPYYDLKELKMGELCMFDSHLGKLAWKDETYDNYDLKIAVKRFKKARDEMFDFMRHQKVDLILFPFGNDFFNIDNDQSTTTMGTPQHTDTRMAKLFQVGVDLIIETMEMALEIAPVEFVFVPGNHDAYLSYFANVIIEKLYQDNPRVTLHTKPTARKYIQFGQVLIGFTHGDKEKKNLLTLMQSEVPELWGKTKFREWHLGHVHHIDTKEHNGFLIDHMPSLSGTDKWHYEQGYTGALKRACTIIWGADSGRDLIKYVNV